MARRFDYISLSIISVWFSDDPCLDAKSGSLSSCASKTSDSSASAGGTVKFAACDNDKTFGYIGDSLTVEYLAAPNNAAGAEDVRQYGLAKGWSNASQVSGVGGRQVVATPPSPGSLDTIQQWRDSGFDPSTWIILLGNNSYKDGYNAWVSEYNTLIDKIVSGPKSHYTIWLFGMTAGGYQPYLDAISPFYQALLAVQTQRQNDANIKVVNLDALLHDGEDESTWWQPDSLHMTATGYAHRNTVIWNAVGPPP